MFPQQCDLGQKSTLHAVKSNRPIKLESTLEEEESSEKPLCSIADLQLNSEERMNVDETG
jgi:hypothetical protein